MALETNNPNIPLLEKVDDKKWEVRWNIRPRKDENGNEIGTYLYEMETYGRKPTIADIQTTIINWFNKRTDKLIKHGFIWRGIQVYLSDENKFNYKAITDEAARRETMIAIWDQENPGMENSEDRPKSLMPVTLKLGEKNTPENFYVFNTLKELQDFFSAGVDHLQNAYGNGWYKIAAFDWTPYVTALETLE